MTEAKKNSSRPSYRRRIQKPKNPAACRPIKAHKLQPQRILSRSASEPDVLGAVSDDAEIREQIFLPRPHTFTDGGFFSSPPPPNFMEEAKVVVSVTVEGSPGPVRTMVRLGATVNEAIGVVVDRYKREGRSPKLDQERADCFELHHSHFSLKSLNKSNKIGEVGSRSFYLRKSFDSESFNSSSEGRDSMRGSEIELSDHGKLQAVPRPPAYLFFSFIAKRLSKMKRRTKRLWRVVLCITCM